MSEFLNNLPDDWAQNYPVPTAVAVGRAITERLEVLLAEIRGLRADLRQAQTPPAPQPHASLPLVKRRVATNHRK